MYVGVTIIVKSYFLWTTFMWHWCTLLHVTLIFPLLFSVAPPVYQSQGPAASSGNKGSSGPKAVEIPVDSSQPITQIQIRLADGSRLVGKFNHTHTVGDIKRFIHQYPFLAYEFQFISFERVIFWLLEHLKIQFCIISRSKSWKMILSKEKFDVVGKNPYSIL